MMRRVLLLAGRWFAVGAVVFALVLLGAPEVVTLPLALVVLWVGWKVEDEVLGR